jgi:hypothetical protein
MIRPTALPSRGYRSMTGGAGHKGAISNSPSTSKLHARNVYRMMAVAAPPAGGFGLTRQEATGKWGAYALRRTGSALVGV